jgi:hypothetical protein
MLRMFCTLLLTLYLCAASAIAAPRGPVGEPAFGPAPRPAMPMILVFRALNPRDYKNPSGPISGPAYPLIGTPIAAVSNSLYEKASARAGAAVHAGFPALDIERELRAAFRCGEANSLCTEMVAIPATSTEPLGKTLLSVLRSHQWSEARLLSFWGYVDEPRLSAHAALEHVQLGGEDTLTLPPAALMGYYWTAPPAPGTKTTGSDSVPHADEWEPGAAIPRESSILAGVAELERLSQTALSWNANNDRKIFQTHVLSLPMFRKVRDAGLQCTGLRQCNELVEGLAATRVWVWDMQRDSSDSSQYGRGVFELQSRPRIAP